LKIECQKTLGAKGRKKKKKKKKKKKQRRKKESETTLGAAYQGVHAMRTCTSVSLTLQGRRLGLTLLVYEALSYQCMRP
jgi:hypothetical protein